MLLHAAPPPPQGEKVGKLIKETRMPTAVALEVFGDSTRSKLRAYVTQAQKEKDRKESSMMIKKMVQFNSLVVTPILDKIQVGGLGNAMQCMQCNVMQCNVMQCNVMQCNVM